MEYLGEVLSQSEFQKRMKTHSSPHFYYMTLKTDEIIDASVKGNLARFINHSCDPNMETQKWIVGGKMKVGLFAIKDIEKGEELSYDYKFEPYGEPQKCLCGAAKCTGMIGSKSKTYDEDDDDDDDEGDGDGDEEEEEGDEEEEEEESSDHEAKEVKVKNPSPKSKNRGINDEKRMVRLLSKLLHCDENIKIIKLLRFLEVSLVFERQK
jgi:histone-lysine N-methyltransferase SETD2